MEGKIEIHYKPEVQPLGPMRLEVMKAYRVASIKNGFMGGEVDDIVIRFPCSTGEVPILNCTKQKMFFDRSSTNRDWDSNFQCIRAFDVHRIFFAMDDEDKPQ